MTTAPADVEPPAPDAVRTLVARGSLYSVATGLQLTVGLVALPVITRLLAPREYGVVTVAMVVQLVLALVGAAGFSEIIPRTYFQADDGPARARTLIFVAALTSLVAAAAAELTGPMWSANLLDLEYGTPLRLAVWSAVPFAVLIAAQALLRASDRVIAVLVSASIATAGAQALGLILVAGWEGTASAYLVGITLGIALAAGFALTRSGIAPRGVKDAVSILATLRISAPIVVHGLALYLIWAGDRAVVSRLEGPAAAGRYQVAYLVGGLTVLFISAIYGAWAPIVFGAADERRWQTLAETSAAVYRIAAIATATAAIGAPAVLVVIAPAAYDPLALATVSAIIALSVIPFATTAANVHVVLWHGRTVALAAVTALVAAVNIALNFALIPAFGLVGAAAASVIAYAIQALLMYGLARRLAPVARPGRTFAAAAVLAGGAFLFAVAAPPGGAWLMLRIVIALVLLGWLLRTLLRIH